MASKADEPGDRERRGEGDTKGSDAAAASLGVRMAVAMTAALVGGAIGGLIFALGVGSFFPRVHVVTERWVCGPNERLEAGTGREGHDENYVVCAHGETRVERDVEGRAFWVLSAMSGLLICGIVFLVNLRFSTLKRARKAKGSTKSSPKPPDVAPPAEEDPPPKEPPGEETSKEP